MSRPINRRECLYRGAAGMFGGALLSSGALKLSAEEKTEKPVRVGVIGLGGRGAGLLQALVAHFPSVSIPALCDLVPERVEQAIAIVKNVKRATPVGYCKGELEYRNMLQRDDLDAVLVATGVQMLAPIAIDVMKAGKHVATEVTGAYTLDDCWGIVEEKERSGKHYMLLEQCCYDDVNLMILGMIKRGIFGEPYYAECSYIHDLKDDHKNMSFFLKPDGNLTWRGRMMADGHGSSYGPHGVASAAKWLGVNDGDRFDYCTAMMSDPRELHAQLVEHYGSNSKPAKYAIQTGDFVTTLIRTVKGKMIRLDYSLTSTRPYSRYYLLQGMQGCFDSRTGIYIRGDGPMHEWIPVDKYLTKYRHPWWSAEGEKASQIGGHGGMDYFCLREFVDMIRNDREPWVDCYDSAAYNALNQCSQLSIDRKGGSVEIPDFTKGKWKDPNWRKARPSPVSAISG